MIGTDSGKNIKGLLFVSALFFLGFLAACADSSAGKSNETVASKGRSLFVTHCVNCHKPAEMLVGPPLKGARSRWKDPALLYEFVRNSQAVIAKDAYAKTLYQQFNNVLMPPVAITNTEIDAILEYCDK
jgi:mono/diheme cytochrome c family protein